VDRFLDGTPPTGKAVGYQGNEEFSLYKENSLNLGSANPVNTERFLQAIVPTVATGRNDIWSTALHEFGHALGVDASVPNYNAVKGANGDAIVPQDLPAGSGTKGAVLTIAKGMQGGNADPGLHLAIVDNSTGLLQHTIMLPNANPGERRFLSAADILAAASIDQFTQVDLDPSYPCPEPAGFVPGITGAVLAAGYARRTRLARETQAAVPPTSPR
jgi:hypothetical protein